MYLKLDGMGEIHLKFFIRISVATRQMEMWGGTFQIDILNLLKFLRSFEAY